MCPGNRDFVADDQRMYSHKRLMRLFIYEAMLTIGESRAISPSNDTGQHAQQVAENPRFLTETPLENAD